MPRVPEAAKPLAEVLDELTAPAAPELYRVEGEGRVRCLACGHRCLVLPGMRGICQVRINREGELRVPFGYVGALQCDPIEKKPFFHVVPGSAALTFGMLGCDLHCGYCGAPGTRVTTIHGTRRIEDLWNEGRPDPEGDQDRRRPGRFIAVITHDGSERPVRWIFRHAYRGHLLRVVPRYLPPLEVTPEHPLLSTSRPGVEPARFIAARELTTAHYLAVPRKHHFSQPVTFDTKFLLQQHVPQRRSKYRIPLEKLQDIVDLTEAGVSSARIAGQLGMRADSVRHFRTRIRRRGGALQGPSHRTAKLVVDRQTIRFDYERRPGIPTTLPLTPGFAELLGYYCAEGCVITQPDRPNSHGVVFAFGLHERHLAKRTTQLLKRVFGVRAYEIERDTSRAVVVDKGSVAIIFKDLCGSHAANKRVPAALQRAERDVAMAFLSAYAAGDGHRTADGQVSVASASEDLAWDVAWLVLRLGQLPGLYRDANEPRGVILGRTVNRQPFTYSVTWYDRPRIRTKYRADERFYYVPIKQLVRLPYDGFVYNLEVEDRHTYLANFFATHNCQNWLTSQALRDEHALVQPQLTTPQELADIAVELRAGMVASSYNEPLITSEWAVAVMDEARRRGMLTAYVSNGNATPEVLDYLRPHIDCYKVDLKAMNDAAYRELGAKLETVLGTIKGLKERGFWVEIVTLVVPGLNDTEEQLRAAARFLASVDPLIPWHVTAFHPDYKMSDRDWTSAKTLMWAAKMGEEEGLKYIYAGNVPGRVGPYEDTRCHHCGTTLVRRVGYAILEDRLTPSRGACDTCGTRIPGIWERPARS